MHSASLTCEMFAPHPPPIVRLCRNINAHVLGTLHGKLASLPTIGHDLRVVYTQILID